MWGNGATHPASLFEITLGDEKDFYDVSIVDGYNLPLVAAPRGVNTPCNATGCVADINMGCPKELQVIGSDEGPGGVIGCKSACEAFRLDQYCCSGEFANPTTCRPSFYSWMFKRACPRAYSYAYDDGTSTFTCKASEYAIMFCPNSGHTIALPHLSTSPRSCSVCLTHPDALRPTARFSPSGRMRSQLAHESSRQEAMRSIQDEEESVISSFRNGVDDGANIPDNCILEEYQLYFLKGHNQNVM
ncbi:UNVERIFIED_CONTAM: Pathogenesis-related thaumatin-like protein 3.5 [Sesamum radiatum]|uniref:Pathogenesis-related thaumatin-like protein 3.5 n=1 Tax=Sesamum radiatum TaxID=300843 RepID=A0AAW2NBK6_SESRA